MSILFRVRVLRLVTLVSVLALASEARADPFSLSIVTPNFLIPIGGQSGTLTVYADGRPAHTAGFNALGSQTSTLNANSTSSGSLTLNLVFSGLPLGDPNFIVTDASVQFVVKDLDFVVDQVTTKVTLREMAILNAVNGHPLAYPINLSSYLPPGTPTDDRTVALNPIDLMPPLSAADFTDPFILSLKLTATATNTGWQSVTLLNTPEAIMTGITLKVDATPVPEPASFTLICLGLTCAAYRARPDRRSRIRVRGSGND